MGLEGLIWHKNGKKTIVIIYHRLKLFMCSVEDFFVSSDTERELSTRWRAVMA